MNAYIELIKSDTGLILGCIFALVGLSTFAWFTLGFIPKLKKSSNPQAAKVFRLAATFELVLFGGLGILFIYWHFTL